MKYNPRNKMLMISAGDLDSAYYLILYGLRNLRETAGLPLTKYEHEGMLTSHDHAAIAMIELGQKMGIDFEVTPHNHHKLDLTEAT